MTTAPSVRRVRFGLPLPDAGDLWGGLAAMLVALPSSIAFGVVMLTAASPQLASAGAMAGIIGAATIGLIASIAGRNGGFISAPCAPAAAVMSGLAADLAQHRGLPLARVLALLALTTLVAAAMQIAYGLLRAGKLIKFIPYQVVSGYMSGVAVIIAFAQIPKLLGVRAHDPLTAFAAFNQWKWPGVIVGVVTIVAMAGAPRLTKAVPGAIIGLASGIASYGVLALFRPELRQVEGNPLIIGTIEAAGSFTRAIAERASSLTAISTADLAIVLGPAFTLSVLLSIDTLKTGVVLDALTRTRHNSNRELVAQGLGNLGSFFGGGMPGAGTMGPTLVNVTSGGRTLWSGVIEGALVLFGFLLLGRFMAWVPIAALSGILLVIAWRMFDFQMFRLLLLPSTRLDFFVIAAVVITAEAVGLIEASLLGVSLAILLFIRNQMRGSVVLRKLDLRTVRSKWRRSKEEMDILEDRGGEALLVQLKDDLFFGTTDQLFTDLERDLNERRLILFDFRRVQSMDYTGAQLFHQMQRRLRERGGAILFSGMPSGMANRLDIERYMEHLGLVGTSESIPIFDTRDSALEWMEEQVLAGAGWTPAESKPPLPLEEIGVFRNLEPETIREIEPLMHQLSVPAGAKVFSAGDGGDQIYFVRRGRIDILLPLEGGKRHHVATFCRGEFFGEMAFLDLLARSADAEAATPSELFVLSRKAFDEMALKKREVAGLLFEQLALALAERLRITNAEVSALEER
ncbi:MAG TPA: SulP family inorganic anion transporter [Thermoanaerobaculia bacterium]|nr:SulP family inorganic anion transporter [Thermoanaerobaculia bacterium]